MPPLTPTGRLCRQVGIRIIPSEAALLVEKFRHEDTPQVGGDDRGQSGCWRSGVGVGVAGGRGPRGTAGTPRPAAVRMRARARSGASGGGSVAVARSPWRWPLGCTAWVAAGVAAGRRAMSRRAPPRVRPPHHCRSWSTTSPLRRWWTRALGPADGGRAAARRDRSHVMGGARRGCQARVAAHPVPLRMGAASAPACGLAAPVVSRGRGCLNRVQPQGARDRAMVICAPR